MYTIKVENVIQPPRYYIQDQSGERVAEYIDYLVALRAIREWNERDT